MPRTVQRVKADLFCRFPCTLDAGSQRSVSWMKQNVEGLTMELEPFSFKTWKDRDRYVFAVPERGPVREAGAGAVLQMQA
ncbi:hypothetical protein K439DRAFT_1075457 [Ramaria rubella]|nr:hypothetical protein K439DRAFT_1075457 [Ramaria rubella]